MKLGTCLQSKEWTSTVPEILHATFMIPELLKHHGQATPHRHHSTPGPWRAPHPWGHHSYGSKLIPGKKCPCRSVLETQSGKTRVYRANQLYIILPFYYESIEITIQFPPTQNGRQHEASWGLNPVLKFPEPSEPLHPPVSPEFLKTVSTVQSSSILSIPSSKAALKAASSRGCVVGECVDQTCCHCLRSSTFKCSCWKNCIYTYHDKGRGKLPESIAVFFEQEVVQPFENVWSLGGWWIPSLILVVDVRR